MKNKKLYILIGILILVLLSVYFIYLKKPEKISYWQCIEKSTQTQNEGWIKVGNPKTSKPSMPCGSIELKETLKTFLNESLSNISPEKEVLGGKFFVTNLELSENNSGIVEYEDGHIALKASFNYKIEKNIQRNSYSVKIENFKILK